MRILIIDDNEDKYTQIKESLNRLVSAQITWCRSKQSGLDSIIKHNIKQELEPFDLIITDNILSIYDNEKELKPYAKKIVDEIRRKGLEKLPIIVCSSDDIEKCDYNYKIQYHTRVSLDETLQTILYDMEAYKKIQEKQKPKDCFEDLYHIDVSRRKYMKIIKPSHKKLDDTEIVGKATLVYRTGIKDSCANYDPFGLCNILNCLYCDNSAYMITLESGEGIIRSDKDIYSYPSEHPSGMTDVDHEIWFYDKIPLEEEIFSYLFKEDSKYKIIRKSDNEIMIDTTKKEIEGPVKKLVISKK